MTDAAETFREALAAVDAALIEQTAAYDRLWWVRHRDALDLERIVAEQDRRGADAAVQDAKISLRLAALDHGALPDRFDPDDRFRLEAC